jgi:transposase
LQPPLAKARPACRRIASQPKTSAPHELDDQYADGGIMRRAADADDEEAAEAAAGQRSTDQLEAVGCARRLRQRLQSNRDGQRYNGNVDGKQRIPPAAAALCSLGGGVRIGLKSSFKVMWQMQLSVLGAERRRRWSYDEKVRLVEETLQAGETVCCVARRHGVAHSLLFTWRRQARQGRLSGDAAPARVPVEITPVAAPIPSAPQPASSAAAQRAKGWNYRDRAWRRLSRSR